MIGRISGVAPGARHRRGQQRQRLPQPARPRHLHQLPDRRCGHPRPAAHGRHQSRAGQLPQRGHRRGTGHGARRRRRSATGDQPGLPRGTDLARRAVVLHRRNHAARRCSTPDLDSAALVGFPAAERYLGFDGHPSTIYVRTQTSQVSSDRVQSLLAATADPEEPKRGRPQPALHRAGRPGRRPSPRSTACSSASARSPCSSARSASPTSWSSPFWSAAPRSACAAPWARPRRHPHPVPDRSDPARRCSAACGRARRRRRHRHLRHAKGWAVVIPALAWAGGIGAALPSALPPGLLPALRAARMSPTQALWTV